MALHIALELLLWSLIWTHCAYKAMAFMQHCCPEHWCPCSCTQSAMATVMWVLALVAWLNWHWTPTFPQVVMNSAISSWVQLGSWAYVCTDGEPEMAEASRGLQQSDLEAHAQWHGAWCPGGRLRLTGASAGSGLESGWWHWEAYAHWHGAQCPGSGLGCKESLGSEPESRGCSAWHMSPAVRHGTQGVGSSFQGHER